jgi:hypothetical protein
MRNLARGYQSFPNAIIALFFMASAGFLLWWIWIGGYNLPGRAEALVFWSTLSLLLCGSFFMTSKSRLNLSISLVSIISTLFVINLGLAIVHPKIRGMASKEKSEEFDIRNKLEFYVDQLKEGLDITLSPSLKEVYQDYEKERKVEELNGFIPLSGISDTLTILCNENGPYVVYRSDQYGFNNSPLVYNRTNKKLLLLGDSFVQGSCVRPGEDLTSKINEEGITTINVAIGGTGPLVQLGALKEYGSTLNPEVVLSVFYENDLEDLWNEYKVSFLKQYLNSEFSQGLSSRQAEIDNFWKQLIKSKATHIKNTTNPKGPFSFYERNKRVFNLYFVRKLLGLIPYSYSVTQTLERYSMVLEATKREAEKLGAEFYLVYLPSYTDVQKGLQGNAMKVLDIAKELGVPVINFYDIVQREEEPLKVFPFRLPGHYSPYGYALLAEVIAQKLYESSFAKDLDN